MKKSYFYLLFALLASITLTAQVGIGTTTPHASAELDIQSTNKGVLIPRITEAQRNSIGSAATGLLIYQTDNTPGFYYYNGSSWEKLTIDTSSLIDHDWYEEGTSTAPDNINDNQYTYGKVGIGTNSLTGSLTVSSDVSRSLEITNTSTNTAPNAPTGINLTMNSNDNTKTGISVLLQGTTPASGISTGLDIRNEMNTSDQNTAGIYLWNTGTNAFADKVYGIYNTIPSASNYQGSLFGVENRISSNGNGTQYTVSNLLDGSGSGEHYGTHNLLYGSGTGEQYGVRNSIGNSGDADHHGSFNQLNGTGSGTHFGTYNDIDGTGSGEHYGTSNYLYGAGTGAQYGIRNEIGNSGDASHYGTTNFLIGAGTGQQYGVRNDIANSGDASHYGSYNQLSGTGSGMHFGTYNHLYGAGTGVQYGINNTIISPGDAAHYGSNNQLNGTGSGEHYGTHNNLYGAGTGMQYGIRNDITNSGNADHYGSYNNLNGSGSGSHFGTRISLTGVGTGDQYGVSSSITNSGDAAHYANHNYLSGSGSGNKYGTYNRIDLNAGGTHYGSYNSVAVNKGWAGFFVGKAYFSNKIGINNTQPNGFLDINANSSGSTGHIEITEIQANDGARILFKNAVETNNKWTLWGKANDTAADSYFNIHHTSNGNLLTIRGNGNVGIRRTPTTNDLEVNGTASKSVAGSWLANSDRRLKKDIATINQTNALDKILALRGVTYQWNDTKTGMDRPKGIQYGFIAQELMEVFPSKVSKDNLGYYQTAYGDYDPLFVQAFKEVNQKIEKSYTSKEALEQEIELLKSKNKIQNQEIALLKERLKKIEELLSK